MSSPIVNQQNHMNHPISDHASPMQKLIDSLRIIGFTRLSEDSLHIEPNGYPIIVRLNRTSHKRSAIDWGPNITIHHKATSDFRQAETIVVLECVVQLLQKGYEARLVELEKTWRLGHSGGGRLDILLRTPDRSVYAMIECKTWGNEYQRERSNTLGNGGQLFTYFNQDRQAKGLYLYASSMLGVGVQRLAEFIRTDTLSDGTSVEELHASWSKTFEQQGIFHPANGAYEDPARGIHLHDLIELDEASGTGVHNAFAEILRRHVISDKSNAFNKMFNLFLCKIADEATTLEDKEIQFQWKSGDTLESLIARIATLYQRGMLEYLGVRLDGKFYSPNLDFAFIDVYDQSTFYQNARIVKETVQLLQPYRLMYSSRHQYLGDFFEMLLNIGVKQESGQFFTPVPLVEGILRSLPISTIIERRIKERKSNVLPYVVDFACGAGHFLTQAIERIALDAQQIDEDQLSSQQATTLKSRLIGQTWAEEHIYGIERDYRLAKVTKIATFLNGDGLANVFRANGLGAFDSEPGYRKMLRTELPVRSLEEFDVVVSNPPFAVSGFLNGLDKPAERFRLAPHLTDVSGEIECLFLERASQLLSEEGVAGIIFPISLLSSGLAIYAAARRLLTLDFRIVSIWELRERTFIATSTTTVCLHLIKRTHSERIDGAFSLLNPSEQLQELLRDEGLDPVAIEVAISNLTDPSDLIDASYDSDSLAQAMRIVMDVGRRTCIAFAGATAGAERTFLGYRFSRRRGHEGMHYITDPEGTMVTKLYSDEGKGMPLISDVVRSLFLDSEIEVQEDPVFLCFYCTELGTLERPCSYAGQPVLLFYGLL